jgi:hypothetical protein
MSKKLGFENKGDFQAHYFDVIVKEYFKGGNAQGRSVSMMTELHSIIEGLSRAWDAAQEESPEN